MFGVLSCSYPKGTIKLYCIVLIVLYCIVLYCIAGAIWCYYRFAWKVPLIHHDRTKGRARCREGRIATSRWRGPESEEGGERWSLKLHRGVSLDLFSHCLFSVSLCSLCLISPCLITHIAYCHCMLSCFVLYCLIII